MSFFVGDLVEVAKEHRTGKKDSEGGRAYIQAINIDNDDAEGCGTKRPLYDVKYLIGKVTSPNVKQNRIKPVVMETIARRRLGDIGNRPSLLSRHHTPSPPKKKQRLQSQSKSSPPKKKQQLQSPSKSIFDTPTLVDLCRQNTKKGNTGLLTIKKMNSENQPGWLRLIHSLSTTNKQLNKYEKSHCMNLFSTLGAVTFNAGELVAHAWGVDRRTINRWSVLAKTNNNDYTRKERKDKGETVFTSTNRCKATFTPKHAFNKINYHYPQREDNISRKKGDRYWVPMEITGSSEGTAKDPKFSLLNWFKTKEIPRLEDIARKVHSMTLKKPIIRYQMDGAGPHRNKVLEDFLEEEFDKRGWIIKSQPSQSPLTNVKDCCIFPAMSKAVTAEQGLNFGSHIMGTEQLWKVVTKTWDNLPLSTIGQAYAGHHQIVNAIHSFQGGDDFARNGGLHFNLRKNCVPYFESETANHPAGVKMLGILDRIRLGVDPLKYSTPTSFEGFGYGGLNDQELRCLAENLPTNDADWEEVNSIYSAVQYGLDIED